MIRTSLWKYVSFDGFPPMLFNLSEDPKEIHDLGSQIEYSDICDKFEKLLADWMRQRKIRITVDHETIEKKTDNAKERGIYFGVW